MIRDLTWSNAWIESRRTHRFSAEEPELVANDDKAVAVERRRRERRQLRLRAVGRALRVVVVQVHPRPILHERAWCRTASVVRYVRKQRTALAALKMLSRS